MNRGEYGVRQIQPVNVSTALLGHPVMFFFLFVVVVSTAMLYYDVVCCGANVL